MITYHATADPRIRIACHGPGNWRTEVTDELGSGRWDITGPPYPGKAIAMGHVEDVLADYFGEQPSRALLADRINRAVSLAREYGAYRGDHQKAWLLNQMVKTLTGGRMSLPDKGVAP